jgi:hypothetical protein
MGINVLREAKRRGRGPDGSNPWKDAVMVWRERFRDYG